MNIDEYKPKPHPAKAIFQAHKIPFSSVAKAVSLSYGHLTDILSGTRTATPEIDSKLKDLATSLNKPKPAIDHPAPQLVIKIDTNGMVATEIQASAEDEQTTVLRIYESIKDDLEKIASKLQKRAA